MRHEQKFLKIFNNEFKNLKKNFSILEFGVSEKAYRRHLIATTNKVSSEFENKSIEEILTTPNLPTAIRNNGGGYYNHCLFWEILSPKPDDGSNEMIALMEKTFGGCDAMKEEFAKAAATRFGSGWAWLCSKNGELSICSSANQDNPLMQGGCGGTPILGLDVWEHAYYLNYQNLRADYISAFFNVVNWAEVSKRYSETL